jgi:hypothetical protein
MHDDRVSLKNLLRHNPHSAAPAPRDKRRQHVVEVLGRRVQRVVWRASANVRLKLAEVHHDVILAEHRVARHARHCEQVRR